jgi:hypothetical protein
VSALAAVAGCGSGLERTEDSHQMARAVPLGHRSTVAPVHRCTARTVTLGSGRAAYAAVVPRQALAHPRPGGGAAVERLGPRDVNGLPTVLGVVSARLGARCAPLWYRVQLSTPPNGSTAWVPAHALRIYRVTTRIVVSLSQRRLDLFRAGRRALHVPVTVGAAATPTPVGRFFINERFVLDDPHGPFGAAALGLSAHSTVLRDWAEGGPIALHGTNEPWLIGSAASHGCVRLRNADILRVLRLAPAGTPVIISS